MIHIPRSFWSRVDRRGGVDACWPWVGCVSRAGYGHQAVKQDGRWRPANAHTVAAYLETGHWPKSGEMVRHACDFRLCCNPRHLAFGSALDNARDAVARRRLPRGIDKPHARLTDRDVELIRQQAASGETNTALGRAFGVSRENVRDTVAGDQHDHLPGALGRRPAPKGSQVCNARFDEAEVAAMRRAHERGATGAELAREWQVSTGWMSRLLNRRIWKHVP